MIQEMFKLENASSTLVPTRFSLEETFASYFVTMRHTSLIAGMDFPLLNLMSDIGTSISMLFSRYF